MEISEEASVPPPVNDFVADTNGYWYGLKM